MKTITKLNYNDIAFFKGISTTDAKWKMAHHIFKDEDELYKNLTKSGAPKISVKEYLDRSLFDKDISSCTVLDGCSEIDEIIKSYNKGIPLNNLRIYSETQSFIGALKFTGKHDILNRILNKEQLLKIQKTWLFKNCYNVHYWSKNTIGFIQSNKWSYEYLETQGISKNTVQDKIREFKSQENDK